LKGLGGRVASTGLNRERRMGSLKSGNKRGLEGWQPTPNKSDVGMKQKIWKALERGKWNSGKETSTGRRGHHQGTPGLPDPNRLERRKVTDEKSRNERGEGEGGWEKKKENG